MLKRNVIGTALVGGTIGALVSRMPLLFIIMLFFFGIMMIKPQRKFD